MADELVRTNGASLVHRGKLSELVQGRRPLNVRGGKVLLLVDVSYSMADRIEGETRKIDALRKVVDNVLTSHQVPLVAFGLSGYRDGGSQKVVDFVEAIPEPQGGTPMAEAIEFGTAEGAGHLILISDGLPNDAEGALEAAKNFSGQIDVVYVGPEDSKGPTFLQELAAATGGNCHQGDLTKPLQLITRIKGLLTAGNAIGL